MYRVNKELMEELEYLKKLVYGKAHTDVVYVGSMIHHNISFIGLRKWIGFDLNKHNAVLKYAYDLSVADECIVEEGPRYEIKTEDNTGEAVWIRNYVGVPAPFAYPTDNYTLGLTRDEAEKIRSIYGGELVEIKEED